MQIIILQIPLVEVDISFHYCQKNCCTALEVVVFYFLEHLIKILFKLF